LTVRPATAHDRPSARRRSLAALALERVPGRTGVSKERRLRVGFVGGGRIADLQAIGWREHARAEIGAICDVDRETRLERAQQWSATPYERLDDLLADPTIDAVEILTPHHLHAVQAIAALEAGKHVSLQKPPARDLVELDAVGAAAERAAANGIQFRVFENYMWYPPHRLAHRLVTEGAIGEVVSLRIVTAAGRLGSGQGWDVPMAATAWRMDPEICGGGMTTFDHGYHCFHMGRFFVRDPVETVHAFIHWLEVPGAGVIDAPALITWRYAGLPRYGSWEVVASLDLAVRSKYYVSDDRIEIRGSRGILWVNRCTGKLLEEPAVVLYAEGETRAFHDLETDWAASFRDGTRDFIDAVLEGRPSPLAMDEARATLAFALAAQVSAREGREVRVAELG
jgi:predicted dehydrogenase